ncbi:MAG: hypothetical protein R3B53_00280 [Candidatus Paceibacterota bacterium]
MTKLFTLKNLSLLPVTLILLVFAYSALAQEDNTSADRVDAEIYPSGTAVPPPENSLRPTPINNTDRVENRPELMPERRENIAERKAEIEEKVEDKRMQIEERLEEGKIKLEEKRAEIAERKTALRAVQQERIINLAANISNRMDAAINRLFTIIERLEQRMAKMKEAGVATEPAEEKLREAARNLSEARSLMQDIDLYVTEATASTEPVGKWQSVKERYLNVGKLIRLAHQNLRESIKLLKEATREEVRPSDESEATTTTSNLIER